MIFNRMYTLDFHSTEASMRLSPTIPPCRPRARRAWPDAQQRAVAAMGTSFRWKDRAWIRSHRLRTREKGLVIRSELAALEWASVQPLTRGLEGPAARQDAHRWFLSVALPRRVGLSLPGLRVVLCHREWCQLRPEFSRLGQCTAAGGRCGCCGEVAIRPRV